VRDGFTALLLIVDAAPLEEDGPDGVSFEDEEESAVSP